MLTKITTLFALTLLISLCSSAEDYKQPGEITEEDFAVMNLASDDYNQCLQDKALTVINDMQDPRQVADYAMEQCAEILQNLNTELEKRNFPPEFRMGYIRRVNHRSAKQLLAMVMVQMSNQPSPPE